jgi:hypothetical protein
MNPPAHRPADTYRGGFFASVSDDAYAALIADARRAGFLRADSRTAKGLSIYISAVFDTNPPHDPSSWQDTRPEWMQAESALRLDPANDDPRRIARKDAGLRPNHAHQTLPIWWDKEAAFPRPVRWFTYATLPIQAMRLLAVTRGITHPFHLTFDDRPTSIVSNVLEAWGQRCITPAYEPKAPPKTRPTLQRRYEMVW